MSKNEVTSVRLKAIEKAKIRRIFEMQLAEFIRATLAVADENPYIKNKIKEKKERVK